MLSAYQTHKLIKESVPEARTVYENRTRGQITIEEYLDSITNPIPKDLYEDAKR